MGESVLTCGARSHNMVVVQRSAKAGSMRKVEARVLWVAVGASASVDVTEEDEQQEAESP